jgi:hypothetical protein
MNVDDEYFWEQDDIYVNLGNLGNEPLGSPPKTFTSSYATDPPIKFSNIPPLVSLAKPSATILPSRQPTNSQFFRHFSIGTKGIST